jgi:hypothetical protein
MRPPVVPKLGTMAWIGLVVVCLAAVVAVLGFVRARRAATPAVEANLATWAEQQGCWLVSAEEHTFRPNPFMRAASGHQRVFAVTVADDAGTRRHGHVLMGEPLLATVDPDTYVVLWDGERL